jgi:flagellar protein FlaG
MDITGVNGLGQIPVAAAAPAAPEQAAGNRDLVQAIKALNASAYLGDNNELTFQLDRNTRLPIIRIVNRQTNEVVEQIPPEYVLRLAEELRQQGQ